MNTLKLTNDQKQLIEKLGVMYEKSGLQPAPARILSLLLVADQTEVTFEEIWNTLKISKSAASNGINLLLTTNKIDYITKPGDRKRYFRSRVMNWKDDMRNSLKGILNMSAVMKEVLAQRPKASKEFNNNLKGLVEFMEFLHDEVNTIFSKWEKKNG